MKIVYRYSLADDIQDDQRRATLCTVYGTLNCDARYEAKQGHTASARYIAKLCRDLIAAFGRRNAQQQTLEIP